MSPEAVSEKLAAFAYVFFTAIPERIPQARRRPAEMWMDEFRAVPVLLLAFFHSTSAVCGIAEGVSELQITVNVYNGINLSSNDLKRAERTAERIFLYAGVQVAWMPGALAADFNRHKPMVQPSAAVLQLRLWTRTMVRKGVIGYETLGFCLSRENGDVVVLADAIQKRAMSGATDFTDLLGLAMAHELGHVLLRSMSHSAAGIMQARWTEECLRGDERGFLRFSPGEAVLIRNEVRRRMGLKGQVASLPY
jgi:hypothetical protein